MISSNSEPESAISLRPVADIDNDLLLDLYASTRADEMKLVPWSEEQKRVFVAAQFGAQQHYYHKTYPDAAHDIICFNGRSVGRIFVARMPEEIRVVDLTVLPTERGQGIGTHLIGALRAEAGRLNKPLTVYVETFNPSLRLFERLGFLPGEQQGAHILMRWSLDADSRPT